MTMSVPAWFAPYYDDQVIHRLQNSGFKLKNTVVGPSNVKGNGCYWRIAASVVASLYKRGDRAAPAGGVRTTVNANFETWQVYEEVFDDDLEKLPMAEMEVVIKSGSMALGRRFDQQIMTALAADAPTSGAGYLADTTNGMTLSNAVLLCEQAQVLGGAEWADGEWYCALPPRLWNQLMVYKQFSSSDYVGADLPFAQRAYMRSWNGVNWFMAPVDWFPVPAASQVDVFMWRKDCVGYGTNYDLKNSIAWEQPITAFTSNMRMAGISKVLLTEGVIRGRFKSDAALAPN